MIEVTTSALAGHPFLRGMPSGQLDVHVPGNERVIIDSLGMGELLGCSWLFPPYRWACGEVPRRGRLLLTAFAACPMATGCGGR